jgi:hypothetical protein
MAREGMRRIAREERGGSKVGVGVGEDVARASVKDEYRY